MSNSLWPHESQHARPPCPSLTPGVHSDSRPSSTWCHPAISSSVVPFSSSRSHGPRIKELDLVILTCSFLSSVELAGKNVKVLERSMRKHKTFYICAQKIIYKITIDICYLYKECPRMSLRPWERLLSETCLWGECLWQKKFPEIRV